MNSRTLGGVEYILEAVADESIPAKDYDAITQIDDTVDLDNWYNRIDAEWDTLPPEVQAQIVDKLAEYLHSLEVKESEVSSTPEDSMVNEATDSLGNEIYDFAAGRKKYDKAEVASMEYVRNDLVETIKAQESMRKAGHTPRKLGYYWDEYWTLMDAARRRMAKGEKFNFTPWTIEGQNIDDAMVNPTP